MPVGRAAKRHHFVMLRAAGLVETTRPRRMRRTDWPHDAPPATARGEAPGERGVSPYAPCLSPEQSRRRRLIGGGTDVPLTLRQRDSGLAEWPGIRT